MRNYENSFIRGPSPSFSDDATSENAMSSTLPLGMAEADHLQSNSDNLLNGKYNSVYATAPDYSESSLQMRSLKQGRNTFAFWTVVALLLVLTVGNLILTLTIIGVLRLGKGIQGMELIPEEELIKFYGTTDLDRVYSKIIGQIDGFADVPVTITGDEGNVYIKLQRNGKSNTRMEMNSSGINFNEINIFEVKDPISGSTIFTTHRPHYNMPKGADNLIVKAASASKLTSPIGQPLLLEAENVYIRGSEGINVDSSSLLIRAGNITINSTQGATIFEAKSGVFLDMDNMPKVSSEFGIRTGTVQYKICVCMPHGTLFRIAIPHMHNGPKISCAHFNAKHDPCATN